MKDGITSPIKRNFDPPFAHQLQEQELMAKDRKRRYSIEQFPELIHDVITGDIIKKYRGITGLKYLMSHHNTRSNQELINSGVIPVLFELAKQQEYPQIQLASFKTISYMIPCNQQQRAYLIKQGLIPLLMLFLQFDYKRGSHRALLIICYLIIRCPHKIKTEAEDNIKRIIFLAAQAKQIQSIIINALKAIFYRLPLLPFKRVSSLLEFFCKITGQDIIETQEAKTKCFTFIAHYVHFQQIKPLLLIQGFLSNIIKHIRVLQAQQDILTCLKIIQKAAGTDDNLDLLIEGGIFDVIGHFLQHKEKKIRITVLRILEKMAFDSFRVDVILGQTKLQQFLIEMFLFDSLEVKDEIAQFFIKMLSHGNPFQVKNYYQRYKILIHLITVINASKNSSELDIFLVHLRIILQYDDKYSSKNKYFTNELVKCNVIEVLEELRQKGRKNRQLNKTIDFLMENLHFIKVGQFRQANADNKQKRRYRSL